MSVEDEPAIAPSVSMRMREGVSDARAFEVRTEEPSVAAFSREPQRLEAALFRTFLMSCVYSGASDITIQSGVEPRCQIFGRMFRATRRAWTSTEVSEVLVELYGEANVTAELHRGEILDFSYELMLPDNTRQRFRVNATGIHGLDGAGVEISIRVLPVKTPTWDGVSLRDDLAEYLMPANGAVVQCGPTGHGKSTTMAAIVRRWLEDQDRSVKIVDLQAPIEYAYRDVISRRTGSASIIGQSEIPRHVKTFAQGVWSALRRNPDIICIGESRDLETIEAMIEASLTGHTVYTTTHAGSVVEALRRMVMVFPGEQRQGESFNLLTSLRFISVQYLVPRRDQPGRVPVREFLEITPGLRSQLYGLHTDKWPEVVADLMNSNGLAGPVRQRLDVDVQGYLEKRMIGEDQAQVLLAQQQFADKRDVRA